MPSPGSNPSATETQTQTQASTLPLSWLSHWPLGLCRQSSGQVGTLEGENLSNAHYTLREVAGG